MLPYLDNPTAVIYRRIAGLLEASGSDGLRVDWDRTWSPPHVRAMLRRGNRWEPLVARPMVTYDFDRAVRIFHQLTEAEKAEGMLAHMTVHPVQDYCERQECIGYLEVTIGADAHMDYSPSWAEIME